MSDRDPYERHLLVTAYGKFEACGKAQEFWRLLKLVTKLKLEGKELEKEEIKT